MAMYREAEAKIMGALAARELTPEQADKKLGDLTEKLWGENIEYEETGEPYAVDITNHSALSRRQSKIFFLKMHTPNIPHAKRKETIFDNKLREI